MQIFSVTAWLEKAFKLKHRPLKSLETAAIKKALKIFYSPEANW